MGVVRIAAMPRGAVTAYVRVPKHQQEDAIGVLERAGFFASRDDGDPDRPADTVDIYVSRHYGMTNPDATVIEGHHHRVAHVLGQADIPHEDRGGGVVFGGHIAPTDLIPVLHATSRQPTGFLIHANATDEIDHKLTAIANALGMGREDLTI
jgi:hypothetical protein